MKSLFINTATKKIVIAIVVNDEIQYLYSKNNTGDLSINLMGIVDEAFKKVKIKPNDIDTIFVTNGPGSFTGIRIGLTVAKVMAWGLKIKVIPISSLELMAATKTDKKYIAPLIDARRDYVFAGLYDSKLNPVIMDSYVLLGDFKKEINNKDVFYVSDDKFDFEVNESNYDILKVINKHKNDEGVNPHKLNPNYLKKTEAEEKLNESR
ncbi:MAG: tRNA (adenosine(37)-N6)-threonylcarbamoyltransferase complex dimerization subunit type 1 TsaB [Bacilli bacterium]|nr:tRNA (adenosine(37)-N6)-threonylcarbamoyltransferase complex dimerization subunit type 1 TsaB [Bacilli bacterium]